MVMRDQKSFACLIGLLLGWYYSVYAILARYSYWLARMLRFKRPLLFVDVSVCLSVCVNVCRQLWC